MPKEKIVKKSPKLRHQPLGQEITKPVGKLREPKQKADNDNFDGFDDEIPENIDNKIFMQAREQR